MKTKRLSFLARAAMTLLLAVLTAATAWADAVNLSVDNDIDEGTAGHYYVNMPATGTNTLTLSDASVTTFKVYDDGGKSSDYSQSCRGTLVLTAPRATCFNCRAASRRKAVMTTYPSMTVATTTALSCLTQ